MIAEASRLSIDTFSICPPCFSARLCRYVLHVHFCAALQMMLMVPKQKHHSSTLNLKGIMWHRDVYVCITAVQHQLLSS